MKSGMIAMGCAQGFMRSFCQNSCWPSQTETVNRDTQTVGGTKGFSFKPTAVRKYYFSTEFKSTSLLCGKLHYTNSSSYHADVQLSRLIKADQWWQPLWEHWCMNPMTTGNAIWFVGLLAAQDIFCGLGRLEKKLTNVSNKDDFTLMKLRPNFMAD